MRAKEEAAARAEEEERQRALSAPLDDDSVRALNELNRFERKMHRQAKREARAWIAEHGPIPQRKFK